MTMEVEPDRLHKLLLLLPTWLHKSHATTKEVESLIGLLSFVAKCVRPARIFLSRMLDFMKGLPKSGRFSIPTEFMLDVRWWYRFVAQYNGVNIIPPSHWSAVNIDLPHQGVVDSYNLHNGISYTGKVSSLYWIGAQTGIMQHRAQSHVKKQRNLTTAKLNILKKNNNTSGKYDSIKTYLIFFDDMLHSTSRLKIVNTGRLSPGAPIQYKDDTLPEQEILLWR